MNTFLALFVGLLVGLALGSIIEHRHGQTNKLFKKQQTILLRAINYLKKHYPDEFILREIINDTQFNYRFDAITPTRREPPHENLP